MTTLMQAVKNSRNTRTQTTNGMRAKTDTSNALVDFFNVVGSARGQDITPRFFAALSENEEVALRTLLWARDVRGGAGERQTFRNLLKSLENLNAELAGRLMHKVPELGRWDDLFAYNDPLNRKRAFAMIKEALEEGNGLCAKWMPREKGTKSKLAKELRRSLGMTPRDYRKKLADLTKVVEQQMAAKDWDGINFSHVPSVAAARYQKAFWRNASEAYAKYVNELKKPVAERDPKVKINAGAVYPHDVVKSVAMGRPDVADEQWKALPDYIGDAKVLPLVDVSGSMTARVPNSNLTYLDIAVSLGLYFSDRTSSDFKDMFLTFSGHPEFVTVKGTLSQKIRQMKGASWGYNTNLSAAFRTLLDTAVKGKVAQRDMPSYLLVLSDMQFDQCTERPDDSALKMIKRRYEEAGYKMPQLVFWNLTGSRYDNVPVKFDKGGTALVSGFSPALLEAILSMDLEDFTPYNIMLKTVMKDKYDYRK